MHKQYQDSRYLYWTVMCTILQVCLASNNPRCIIPDNLSYQAKESSTSPEMRSLLYKLAHRLLESCSVPSFLSAERFCLHLSILQELQMLQEAQTLVDSDIGKAICSSNLVCNHMRREIWRLQGRTSDEGQRAESMILKKWVYCLYFNPKLRMSSVTVTVIGWSFLLSLMRHSRLTLTQVTKNGPNAQML